MSEWFEDLVGDDWEDYCGSLLRHRYRPVDVQAVPAVEGDLGIDYWIRGCGDIYQCYGTEFGDSVAERLRLQKKKLSGEVRKLRRNADRIAGMIAPALCSRYVFLVPRHDRKELLEYAAKKTEEIRGAELSFCAEDFEIAVQSFADFAAEKAALLHAGLAVPRLIEADPDGQQVHDWLTDNGELARTIREKVEAVHPTKSADEIDSQVQTVVAAYLRREAALAGLEAQYPELYERTRRVITTRRKRLQTLGGQTAEVPMRMLVSELDELTEALKRPGVGMEESDSMTLSSGTVASWLADCTLDPR